MMRLRLVPVEYKVCPDCTPRHAAAPPKETTPIRTPTALHGGDYVLHEHYGIGIFRGVDTRPLRGVESPYLHIEYDDGTVVFISTDQLASLKQYTGIVPPEVTRHDSVSGLFEGEQCPRCKEPFAPQTTKRVHRDRLILVDVDPPVYERELRFKCRNKACDNLYTAEKCPLCKTIKPQRPMTVWVRTFAVPESLEELQQRDILAVEGDDDDEDVLGEETTEHEGDHDAGHDDN